MFVISFFSSYITNSLPTYYATHSLKFALLLLIIWFQISQLVPLSHSEVRRSPTKNTDTFIFASSSVNTCTAIIFYHPPLILFVSNNSGRSFQSKTIYSTITGHKLWLMHPTWTFWLAIPFGRNCTFYQINGKISLKVMVAIVSIEILLPLTFANNWFGKIAYYRK